jgi:sensor histidine kinase YesM
MKTVILDSFMILIQTMKYTCIYSLFFSAKIKQKWTKIISIIVGAVLLGTIMEMDICNPIIPYTLYMIVVTIILYERLDVKIVLLGMWLFCIITLLDEAIRIADTKLIPILATSEVIERYTTNILTLLFLFILSRLLKRNVNGKIEKISVPYFVFFLVLTFIDTLIITFLSQFVFKQVDVGNKALVYFAFGGTVIGMLIQIVLVMLLAVSRNVYKEKEELSNKYLSEQNEHYAYLEERESETKRFRHDIKSHMVLLNDFLEDRECEKAKEYIYKVYGELNKLGKVISVNNGIVNAILNRYSSDAQKEHVKLHIKGQLPEECHIEAFDLCTIFSNLLSNALEAAKESEGKSIEVECGYTTDMVFIIIQNDYSGNVEGSDGKFFTNKRNKEYHGFGLQNIERSVKKYFGNMNIEASDKFIVRIRMMNKVSDENK